MEKVKILLSGNRGIQFYADAVEAAGAEAIAKYLPEIDTGYDALLLCGGNDINPVYYNELQSGADKIDGKRDAVEFALLKAYVDAGKPVLGICRGHQLINVFFGGTLCQDIPETLLHKDLIKFYTTHVVSADLSSIAGKLYGTTFTVNSCHHQVVDKLGDGLKVTAYWNDKYVEAFEHTSLPIFGFQWHPEQMCVTRKREDTVDGLEIFKYFVDIVKKNKEAKI